MANNFRRKHISPGVYSNEIDLTAKVKSLGLTSLGVVGETLKGPAFQPIAIEDWSDFQTTFGGTSTEKFQGSKFPKYELPYIAKAFLSESNRLNVVRVLGLSGVNAGPAWLITASFYNEEGQAEDNGYRNVVIGVLRSRGAYRDAYKIKSRTGDECDDTYAVDGLEYFANEVYLEKSTSFALNADCEPKFQDVDETVEINSLNKGRFTIVVKNNYGEIVRYPVSLNSGEKNYIYNVIGSNPSDGKTEVYVEELYDVALKQLIEQGNINQIDFVNAANSLSVNETNTVVRNDGVAIDRMVYLPNVKVMPKYNAVNDILTIDETALTRAYEGKRYLYSKAESINPITKEPLKVHVSENNGLTWVQQPGQVGHIYTVVAHTTKDGQRKYYYGELVSKINAGDPSKNTPLTTGKRKTEALGVNVFNTDVKDNISEAVEVLSDRLIYVKQGEDVRPITLDINNYKEHFRNAMTPWFVSEVKGNGRNIELTKLFRFHTISDGDTSNTEIKVSIADVDPVNGTFTVIVRNYFDSDTSIAKLETFPNCNLVRSSKNFIGSMIGTIDGEFIQRSKYIMVEVSDNDVIETSVPCGFLGYPIRDYSGTFVGNGSENLPNLTNPYMKYNTTLDDTLRHNKQYFGMSDLVGVDDDVLRYKGVEAYNGIPRGLTPSFHLDSRILNGRPDENGVVTDADSNLTQTVTVDGITGYEWVTVAKNQTTQFGIEPRIGTADVMLHTIFEDKNYRKFTAYFYGGFDGWDYYRPQRTNTDEFKYNQYKGTLSSVTGYGENFSVIKDASDFKFKKGVPVLNTDYYAYLAGIREFSDPTSIDINIFATPGIDYVHQNQLVGEAIEMIEEERQDSIYVVTTPDRPSGSSEAKSDMFDVESVVVNREMSNIDSSYVTTHFPWVKYYDKATSMLISLPPTKDIIRDIANTDNYHQPWKAYVGIERGLVDAEDTRRVLNVTDTDLLYESGINYIMRFPNTGLRLWGNKNMQQADTALNRVNVRRLLNYTKAQVLRVSRGFIFEPNNHQLVSSFKTVVGNVLSEIKSKGGVIDYRIEVDDSDEARERLALPAKIFIKPTLALEYIELEYILTPQGLSLNSN